MPIEEKRASERLTYISPVSFIALGDKKYPPNNVSTLCETVDISNGGMRIRIKERLFKEGSVIKVLMPVHELKVTVPVLTEVRWVREEMPENYQIGLRFLV
jgi:c-di-GMP-binding flagellar brake protein YcgR